MHNNGYEARTEMRETQTDMSETQTEICEIHHDMNEARTEVCELHHDKTYSEGPLAPEATLRQRCSWQRHGKKPKWGGYDNLPKMCAWSEGDGKYTCSEEFSNDLELDQKATERVHL